MWWDGGGEPQSSAIHLLFKARGLKDRHPTHFQENWPAWIFPNLGSRLPLGPHLFPAVPLPLIVPSLCILNTHSPDQLCRLSKWSDAMIWKRHAFKAAFIKNFIKGFATFSFAFCSSFSLNCKSEQSTQRHSLKIHHTSSVIKQTTLWDSGNKQPRILSHLFVP